MTHARNRPSATYRGYRKQALYVLWRLATDSTSHYRVYRPEGAEDLAVYEGADRLVEAVQVKDRSSPLAISDFNPRSPVGFFARAKRRFIEHPGARLWLATFGPLGPELASAIATAGAQRSAVIGKIVEKNPALTRLDCERILNALYGRVVHISEAQLRHDILRALAPTIAGAHQETAVELLQFWSIAEATVKFGLEQTSRTVAYLFCTCTHAFR